MIGQQQAVAALFKFNWYLTKSGQGSEVLVYYTEESCTEWVKKIKGGSQLEVPEGKQIILDGMMAGFNEAMTGEDDEDSDAMEE